MNRDELKTLTALILNHNEGQTDQDFTAAQINTAIGQAYNEELIEMAENSLMEHLISTYEFVWTSGTVTKALPSSIEGKLLLRLANVTNNDLGDRLLFSSYGADTDLFWKDKSTMQWGTTGPSSDTTIRATYIATAESLVTGTSVPFLIPLQFHHLLAWTAACWLKDVAEETSPGIWLMRVQKTRERLWKYMSRGKPVSSVPSIRRFQPMDGGSDGF